jgi:hypothetical protein
LGKSVIVTVAVGFNNITHRGLKENMAGGVPDNWPLFRILITTRVVVVVARNGSSTAPVSFEILAVGKFLLAMVQQQMHGTWVAAMRTRATGGEPSWSKAELSTFLCFRFSIETLCENCFRANKREPSENTY